jgi:predicted flap endonuclease-1-like 5' DNA nuclease
MEDLSKLINIGDVLAKELTEIGVTSHADLVASTPESRES